MAVHTVEYSFATCMRRGDIVQPGVVADRPIADREGPHCHNLLSQDRPVVQAVGALRELWIAFRQPTTVAMGHLE